MAKLADKQNGKPPPEAAAIAKKQIRPSSLFPQDRLQDVLMIAETIENTNAGQPTPPSDIAIAIGKSPGSTGFHRMLSSSLKYGLTTGSYKSSRITLTSVGTRIVSPTSDEERHQAIVEAVLTPQTFRDAYGHFRGKKLPETQYLMNTLIREFNVPQEWSEQGGEIFRENLQFAGLLKQATTGLWVADEDAATPQASVDLDRDGDDEGTLEAAASEVLDSSPPNVLATPAAPPEPERPKAIFIGHGRDKTALTALTKILDEWGLPYKVAEYEPNAFRPISKKVADLMAECDAAILIFSADRELQDTDGNTIWLSSENVSHELGAASVLYDGRVVVFKEHTVDLASNYSGIGFIEFEKGKLSAKAMELFREIRHFGLIKISIGA